MKKILSILLFTLTVNYLFSQTDFKWEKIDSVTKTKDQIYSDTKMFIAENWKSAQNVIQNDDKEAGLILVKGTTSIDMPFMLNNHNYTYSHTAKFYMKDKKYRIIIEDVKCVSATCNGTIAWPLMEPGQIEYGKTGVPNKKAEEIMAILKSELQGIVDRYEAYLKTESINNSDW